MDETDRQELDHVLALVQEQMRDLAVMEEQRAEITATASTADGSVEVTVDAQRVVTSVVIDESYLEGFELAELGGFVVDAVRDAAQEVQRRSAALLTPLSERRESLAAFSDSSIVAPDLQELFAGMRSSLPGDVSRDGSAGADVGWDDGPSHTTVRQ
jgi:DNA-binding protein YbaB